MVTTAHQAKVIHGLSNHAIVNDLERPQTQISRSDHSLRLNISEMAKGTAMEGEWETVPKLSHDTIFSDFE